MRLISMRIYIPLLTIFVGGAVFGFALRVLADLTR